MARQHATGRRHGARAHRRAPRRGQLARDRRRWPASATYGADGDAGGLPAREHGRRPGRASTAAASSSQGDDFTVRGGAADAAIWQKMVWAERAAHDLRQPLVRLVDGTGGGGSVKTLETMGFSYVPPLPGFDLVDRQPQPRARSSPPRSARARASGAARVVLSHFSVIVREDGPALRRRPARRRLGDGRDAGQGAARRRAGADPRRRGRQRGRRRGGRDRAAQALPLLPARRASGRRRRSTASTDPADRREEELLAIVPRDERKTYKMRRDRRARLRPRQRLRARRGASGAR